MAFKTADPEASTAGVNETKSGIPFWTPPAGEGGKWKNSRIRILPPRDDHPDNKYYHWIATHGNLPGARGPVRCPQKNDNLPCPACVIGNDLWQANRKEDARKWFSSWRGFVNIVVLNANGDVEDPTVKVWGMPKTLLEEDLDGPNGKISELPKAERDITSLTTGRDVFVRRKGKEAKDTRYEVSLAPDASPFLVGVSDADGLVIDKIAEACVFLPDIYPRVDQTQISGLLEAGSRPALPPENDPFADDDDGDVVDGEFKSIPAVPETYNPFPDNDDDEDEEDAAPAPATTGVSKEVSEARKRLQARLGGS